MSIVLSWENPPGLIDLNVRRVVIHRTDRPGALPITVTDDACWGVAVDGEGADPKAYYEIEYLGAKGQMLAHFEDEQIQRWDRPASSCLITWALIKPDGSPDANRIIEVSDKHVTGNFIRRLTTNHAGRAQFVAMYGERLTYFLEGDLYELDAVAPKLREVTSDQLRASGSLLIRDRRAWF